jgi:hypothetical protein
MAPYLNLVGTPSLRTYILNCVRPITFFFEIRFYNYFIEMTTILRRHVTLNIWVATLTLQQNRVRPITLLFEVGYYNYFIEMITILRRHVARNILVATLKVRAYGYVKEMRRWFRWVHVFGRVLSLDEIFSFRSLSPQRYYTFKLNLTYGYVKEMCWPSLNLAMV